jgi:hypothetical protein
MKDSKPIYRVLMPIILSSNRMTYMPGQIVDMSHLPDASIRYFVDGGFIETADGKPENEPQSVKSAARERPCCD